MTRLGPGAEFDRIRTIARVLGTTAEGLGDDCAFIPEGKGWIALSCDLSVENVHFRRGWLGLEEIGWRAASAALSDLAAVGAEAIGILCALAVPPEAGEHEIGLIMSGVGLAVAEAGGVVLGGDLSRGPVWAIDVTVAGRTLRPVRRAGASPGDRLWVTGELGGARAALEAWVVGAPPSPDARVRFAHPTPRLAAGRWLAEHGARAMIDVSDGLAGDAGHLAAASYVAIDVELSAIPVGPEVAPAAAAAGVDAAEFAAMGGEDYELLVVMPPEFDAASAGAFRSACHLALTEVGAVRAGTGVRFLRNDEPRELRGYDHFG